MTRRRCALHGGSRDSSCARRGARRRRSGAPLGAHRARFALRDAGRRARLRGASPTVKVLSWQRAWPVLAGVLALFRAAPNTSGAARVPFISAERERALASSGRRSPGLLGRSATRPREWVEESAHDSRPHSPRMRTYRSTWSISGAEPFAWPAGRCWVARPPLACGAARKAGRRDRHEIGRAARHSVSRPRRLRPSRWCSCPRQRRRSVRRPWAAGRLPGAPSRSRALRVRARQSTRRIRRLAGSSRLRHLALADSWIGSNARKRAPDVPPSLLLRKPPRTPDRTRKVRAMRHQLAPVSPPVTERDSGCASARRAAVRGEPRPGCSSRTSSSPDLASPSTPGELGQGESP